MEVYLNTGQFFAVPCAVAEHLLRLASHDQLKVLLYVLCHANTPLSAEQITQACSVRADAVEEALAFWQNVNILGSEQLTPVIQRAEAVRPEQQEAPAIPPQAQPAPQPAPVRQSALSAGSTAMNLMPSEIAARKEQNQAMAELFAQTEKQAGRLLTQTEYKSLIWMHEYLRLSPDVILMLVTYCIGICKFSPAYMEKIALEWTENGVTSHENVQQDIRRREENRTYTGRIMRIFSLTRKPTPKQQTFIDRWQSKGFSFDLVSIACEKTRDAIGDTVTLNTFKYADAILSRWDAAGIRTAQAAREDDAAVKSPAGQKKAPAKQNNPKSAKSSAPASFTADDLEKLYNQF